MDFLPDIEKFKNFFDGTDSKNEISIAVEEAKKYDIFNLISRVSALNLFHQNQTKSVILDTYIEGVLCQTRDQFPSKYTISSGKFRKIINQISDTSLKYSIDPPENMFVQNVMFYGNYRVLNLAYYTELKKTWKVSIAAMIRRAKDLDIITADDYSRLMRNMQKQGIRKIEPLDDELVTAEPSLLRQAIKILFDQKVFTPNEFLEELSREYGLTLYPKDIETLLGLKKGTFEEKENPKMVINVKPRKE